MMRRLLIAALVLALTACGGPTVKAQDPLRASRRSTVVWLDASGLDEETAVRLSAAGVDEVVVPMGTVFITGSVPVMRLSTPPPVTGPLPVGVELRLELPADEVDAEVADALWRVLAQELQKLSPAELLFDLPRAPEGSGLLVQRLAGLSGLPVRPVVTAAQLIEGPVKAAVGAAGGAVVLCFGRVALVRPGAEASDLPLDEQLAPLAPLAVKPRVAVVVRAAAQPDLSQWESFDPLTEDHATEIFTDSILDRTFRFRQAMEWSGRRWTPGESVALGWSDAARLDQALGAVGRLQLPQPAGWDIIGLPPAAADLGLSRAALVAYLRGEGPAPALAVKVEGSRTRLRVSASNSGPFGTAVSAFGNWVEVAVPRGTVKVTDRGGFDGMVLGKGRGAAFQRVSSGAASVARLLETYVAPGEAVAPATLQVAGGTGFPLVTWHMTLSTGEPVEGTAAPSR